MLDKIIDVIPHPTGDCTKPLKALIFDSMYDNFKGAICNVRIVEGSVKKGDLIKMFSNGKEFECTEVGIFTPSMLAVESLNAGMWIFSC